MVEKFRTASYSKSGRLISPKICMQFNFAPPKMQKNELVNQDKRNAASEMKHLAGQLSF